MSNNVLWHLLILDGAPPAQDLGSLAVGDVDGDGHVEIVTAGNDVLLWYRPATFERGIIDEGIVFQVGLVLEDLDGDGLLEVIVGEHDPFKPYRSRSRLYVYKKAEPQGRAWYRYPLDERFEHHDGTRVFEVAPGRLGIVSHGWADSRYVHLWEQV